MEKGPIVLRRPVFAALSLVLAATFAFLSKQLFELSGKGSDFTSKLGEHALQIAVIVLVGAAVKEFLEWRTNARANHALRVDLRADFLRRLRSVHMSVLNSRVLMRAHKSAKTWAEQSRRLIASIPELEEIAEDLRVAPALFGEHQPSILNGLEGVVRYLERCREEYVASHEFVDSDWHSRKVLADTIDERRMSWAKDFLAAEGTFSSDYTRNLLNAKLPMRQAVFAGPVPSPRLQPTALVDIGKLRG